MQVVLQVAQTSGLSATRSEHVLSGGTKNSYIEQQDLGSRIVEINTFGGKYWF